MKDEIKNVIGKLNNNQIFMKDLVDITNSSSIIHKNFFLEKIKTIETKKKYINTIMSDINK